MIGNPKYKVGDMVTFDIGGKPFSGTVEIVDAYGTFEQNEDVSYDIMVENSPHANGKPCLYKHIIEPLVSPAGES